MSRQAGKMSLGALIVLGSLACATADEPKKAGSDKQIAVDLDGGVKLEMLMVPSGDFIMGSEESSQETLTFFNKIYGPDLSAECLSNEHPHHRVRITKPFYLGKYHVTRGQFRQFVKATGFITDAEKGKEAGTFGWNPEKGDLVQSAKYSWQNTGFEQTDEHPVVCVSWNDAVAFCKWLSKKEGKTYRLPTEAEWEYACRGGTTTRYFSGDDPETLAKVGNVADATIKAKFPRWKHTPIKASDGYMFTSPVGSFKSNSFGLYDMHGNAWQWCMDNYADDYYAKSPTDDPTNPDLSFFEVGFVIRGGSWRDGPMSARSAKRDGWASDFRAGHIGFRVATD